MVLMQKNQQTFSLLTSLNQAINRQFRYQIREEAGVQTLAQTIEWVADHAAIMPLCLLRLAVVWA